MASYALMAMGTGYAASEYIKLCKVLDKYPEKLKGVVGIIKEIIDLKTYEFLTNSDCFEEPLNPAIAKISGHSTKIVEFRHIPGYVVKSSKSGLSLDFNRKIEEGYFGESYGATNDEGGVTRDFFRFARRVIVAKKLRKIVKENKLDLIKVPKKYLCSYPGQLIPSLSTPFYNRRIFILCEKVDGLLGPGKTKHYLQLMSNEEQEKLAQQIHIFFLKAGILDLLPHNYYIEKDRLVIFDTEPMSLTSLHLFCVSPSLRAARVNFRNLIRNYKDFPPASILVTHAERSIKQIRAEENQKFPRAICIVILFMGAMVLLNYYKLLPIHVGYSGRNLTITL